MPPPRSRTATKVMDLEIGTEVLAAAGLFMLFRRRGWS
jgi:hypothetical protein